MWVESVHLLPSGREQNEVLRVMSIPTGILLYCPQSSMSFFCWLKTCHIENKPFSPGTSETAKPSLVTGMQ